MTVTFRNRHPADALADVRSEIKQLRIQETELREILLAEDADLCGVQYDAVVSNEEKPSLDQRALVEHFGAEALQAFYRVVTFQVVRLRRHVSREAGRPRNPRVYENGRTEKRFGA